MLTSNNGVGVIRVTNEEFAKMILEEPSRIFTFTPRLDDNIGKLPWYHVTNVEILGAQTVIFNNVTGCGGDVFAIDLCGYDANMECVLDETECIKDIVSALDSYMKKVGEKCDLFYIDVKSCEQTMYSESRWE